MSELHASASELREWAAIRDSYRKLASRAKGPGTKRQALDKAAEFQTKINAEKVEVREEYEAKRDRIDLEQRALILTPAEAKRAKEALAMKALNGGFGALSEEGLLRVKGDLRELAEAVQDSTSGLEAHTVVLQESARVLREFSQAASSGLANVESGALVKNMADLIEGQIGGQRIRPKARRRPWRRFLRAIRLLR